MINHTTVTNCIMFRKSPEQKGFAAWESVSRESGVYMLALLSFLPKYPFIASAFFPVQFSEAPPAQDR